MNREEAGKVLEMFLHKQCDLARTEFAYDANTVWNAVNIANESLEAWDRVISDIKCLKGVWLDYSENPLFEAAIMSLNDALNIIEKHLSKVEIDTESED